jgi:CHAT domain-containing protein
LRQAQLAFLQGKLTRSGEVANPAHPFYWSPFVLTGNSW